jgi:hypothetical protein
MAYALADTLGGVRTTKKTQIPGPHLLPNPRVRKEMRGERIADLSITRGRARLRPSRDNPWAHTEVRPPIVGVTRGLGLLFRACAGVEPRSKAPRKEWKDGAFSSTQCRAARLASET